MLPNRLKFLAAFLLIFCMPTSAALAESKLVSQWHKTDFSSARAHILQATENGIQLAIEIKIIDKYKTYWQAAGSTGVPPRINISGLNIAENTTKMSFPFPHKYINKYGETWGYKDNVVLFVNVKRQDVQQNSTINIVFDYAVCDEICLLEQATFNLNLQAGKQAATMSALRFKKFKKQIPQPKATEETAFSKIEYSAPDQLILTTNAMQDSDIFITDVKNRFYQHMSDENGTYMFKIHGLPIDEAFKTQKLTIHFATETGNYFTQLALQ